MTTATPVTTTPPLTPDKPTAAAVAKKKLTSPWASLAAIVIAVLWTLPTFGLLVSSFRPERAIKTTGWWTFFTDPQVTMDNYKAVLDAENGAGLGSFFVNSLVITIPSVQTVEQDVCSLGIFSILTMHTRQEPSMPSPG